jgi:hypothetical protein
MSTLLANSADSNPPPKVDVFITYTLFGNAGDINSGFPDNPSFLFASVDAAVSSNVLS